MSTLSILAMTLVVYLFGGYVDSPNQRQGRAPSAPSSYTKED